MNISPPRARRPPSRASHLGHGLRAAFGQARRGLALRRRRTVLSGLGIALAAAMLTAGVVIADGLGLGFNRAANQADLADLIVRFNPQSEATVIKRIRSLPDVAAYATRFELLNTTIAAPGHKRLGNAVAEVLNPSRRRGYAVVAGHGITGDGNEVMLEKSLADAWGITPGGSVYLRGLGQERVVGLVEGPDDVGYPLAAARYYLSIAQIRRRFHVGNDPQVNFAEVWLRNRRYANEVLVQARDTSFGLHNLQFATRDGVRILHDQAAGIVIDLLVALSLIALITAGVMLAASARAEVQRRLGAIGIRRAIGATRGFVVFAQAVEAAFVAVPAATLGAALGTVSILGPTNRLLTLLNEPGPGSGLVAPLIVTWLAAVALPTLGAAWPAYTAAGGSVIGLLRGAGLNVSARGRRRGATRRRRGGLLALGLRLAAARRVRLIATVAMLALSAAFVLLMISLAGALSAIETDPSALGKRYQLTATLPPADVGEVRRIPGVLAAEPRYEVQAADSYSLGEIIDVIAYPGHQAEFEAPPLDSGRRLRGNGETEVGQGLADALGLTNGSTLSLALSSGAELRLRVSGIVSSLDHDGRVAYIPAAALLHDEPSAGATIAVRLTPQADPNAVFAALKRLGAEPAQASGATSRGVPLVNVLRTILRAVAIVDGLVCLYALIQACTLTVQERRRGIAVLRACGAGAAAVRRLLFGAVVLLVAPAAAIGIVLERFVLGPALSHLAVNYATLSLIPSTAQMLGLVAGLAVAGAGAVYWVAFQASREAVVEGLAG